MTIKYYIDSSTTFHEIIDLITEFSTDDTKKIEFYIKQEEYDKMGGKDPLSIATLSVSLYGRKLNIV
jgi:hypothetical protein